MPMRCIQSATTSARRGPTELDEGQSWRPWGRRRKYRGRRRQRSSLAAVHCLAQTPRRAGTVAGRCWTGWRDATPGENQSRTAAACRRSSSSSRRRAVLAPRIPPLAEEPLAAVYLIVGGAVFSMHVERLGLRQPLSSGGGRVTCSLASVPGTCSTWRHHPTCDEVVKWLINNVDTVDEDASSM